MSPYGLPVEIRLTNADDLDLEKPAPPQRLTWMRPRGTLPDDPLIHAAVLVYAGDHTLLSTAGRIHGYLPGKAKGASLDHAMWIHQVPRFDDWILYVTSSPVAHAARGLIRGSMFDRAGIHLASTTQEGLIRKPRA
jgi:acyl-CoA thioesterase-2